MLSFKRIVPATLVAVCLVVSLRSNASPVAWSNSTGSTTNLSWTGGANDNGLAGDPNVVGGSFAFFPSLKAFTLGSGTVTAGDVIRVTLVPDAGKRISAIHADFFGDATVLESGAAGYSATLDAKNHGTSAHVTNMLTPPDVTTEGTIADHLDLTVPNGYGKVDLSVALNLHASGQVAFSELKVVKFSVDTAPANVVPLPAAIVMAPAGALVAAIAKRRMTRRA